MRRVQHALVLPLLFEQDSTAGMGKVRRGRELRLAVSADGLRGPAKYRALEHRRRQAQIKARHELKLLD